MLYKIGFFGQSKVAFTLRQIIFRKIVVYLLKIPFYASNGQIYRILHLVICSVRMQHNKHYTIVIYDSRVELTGNLLIPYTTHQL